MRYADIEKVVDDVLAAWGEQWKWNVDVSPRAREELRTMLVSGLHRAANQRESA